MKDFFKMILASTLGFIVAGLIFMLISILVIMGMVNSISDTIVRQPSVALQNNSVLHIKLDGIIEERVSESDPITEIIGGIATQMGLNDIVGAIRKAKNNDNIKGIYLESKMISASSATLFEIRNELLQFKESGKFIVSYADNYLQSGYFISSIADKIAINPEGTLDIHGLSATPIFYKDALDKIGVEMQLFKVGTYKSFAEPYIQTEMSESNREQVSSYLNNIWSFMKSDIAESRNIDLPNMDIIANEFPMLKKTDYLLSKNLVDTILYESEMKDYLRELIGIDKNSKISSATVADMKNVKAKNIKKSSNSIGLLYAVGGITSGNGSSGIQDKHLITQIEKLKKDKDIKAVVLRVNSGGGSAYASEQIWKAITELKEEKPVVVSMGDLAASGGYYIACNADRIVASKTTLTGSIGIFGLIPNISKTFNKIGISTDVVKTNEFADFGNISRPFSDHETEMMQAYINNGYDLFLKRCAEGRNIPKDSLAQYAEGRVWTGSQAKEIGLVDELGGIEDAIKIAAELANLGKSYAVYEYPKMKSKIEELISKSREDIVTKYAKEWLGGNLDAFIMLKDISNEDFMQARIPYDLNIR